MRWIVVVLLACGSPETTREQPRPTAIPDAAPAGDFALPETGDFKLPIAWIACVADGDCEMVSMGCCDATPVRRDHAVALRDAMQRAKRRYCPPKDACGPSKNGTWDGEAAVCRNGQCTKPGGI